MGQSNAPKPPSSEEENCILLRKFFETLSDHLRADKDGHYEALESYTIDQRIGIYQDFVHYRQHFIRGYQILLEIYSNPKDQSNNSNSSH